jgi:hypothetical protein
MKWRGHREPQTIIIFAKSLENFTISATGQSRFDEAATLKKGDRAILNALPKLVTVAAALSGALIWRL